MEHKKRFHRSFSTLRFAVAQWAPLCSDALRCASKVRVYLWCALVCVSFCMCVCVCVQHGAACAPKMPFIDPSLKTGPGGGRWCGMTGVVPMHMAESDETVERKSEKESRFFLCFVCVCVCAFFVGRMRYAYARAWHIQWGVCACATHKRVFFFYCSK